MYFSVEVCWCIFSRKWVFFRNFRDISGLEGKISGAKRLKVGAIGTALENFSDFRKDCFLKFNKKQKFCYIGFRKIFRVFFKKLFLKTAIKSKNEGMEGLFFAAPRAMRKFFGPLSTRYFGIFGILPSIKFLMGACPHQFLILGHAPKNISYLLPWDHHKITFYCIFINKFHKTFQKKLNFFPNFLPFLPGTSNPPWSGGPYSQKSPWIFWNQYGNRKWGRKTLVEISCILF